VFGCVYALERFCNLCWAAPSAVPGLSITLAVAGPETMHSSVRASGRRMCGIGVTVLLAVPGYGGA
jgi:hypothetical protein